LGGTVSDGDSLYVTTGNDTLNTNVSYPSFTFPVVTVGGEFDGSFGDNTAYFEAQVTLFTLTGSARNVYIKGGSGTGIVAKCDLRPTRNDCNIVFGTGVFTAVEQRGGSLVAVSTADVNLYKLYSGTALLRGNTHNTPTIEMYGGTLVTERDFDTAVVNAGRLHVSKKTVTPATVTVKSGAMLDYRGGNLTNLYGEPEATLDLTKLSEPITITNCYLSEGCAPLATPGMVTVTNYFMSGDAKRFQA